MAVTNQKQYIQEEQQRINNQKAVSQANAKNYNDSPVSAEKRKSWQVTTPAATYTMGQDPGQYKSRYQPALDSILAQLSNPDEFKYEFNGDELFKQYADMYTQKGKQASLDAMGQLAGLTGGYGNSYAQQVGQQQYQQYLGNLYDVGLDLHNIAYGKYRDQIADLQNLYNDYMGAEQYDYGRYGDAYGAYVDELNRQEAIRQYNERLAFEQAQAAEDKRRWDLLHAPTDAGASYSGGSGKGGDSNSYVRLGNDKYEDKNGKIVDGSKLKDSDVVYEGAYNAVTNAGNAIGNALRSASQNASDYVKWLLGGGR